MPSLTDTVACSISVWKRSGGEWVDWWIGTRAGSNLHAHGIETPIGQQGSCNPVNPLNAQLLSTSWSTGPRHARSACHRRRAIRYPPRPRHARACSTPSPDEARARPSGRTSPRASSYLGPIARAGRNLSALPVYRSLAGEWGPACRAAVPCRAVLSARSWDMCGRGKTAIGTVGEAVGRRWEGGAGSEDRDGFVLDKRRARLFELGSALSMGET